MIVYFLYAVANGVSCRTDEVIGVFTSAEKAMEGEAQHRKRLESEKFVDPPKGYKIVEWELDKLTNFQVLKWL